MPRSGPGAVPGTGVAAVTIARDRTGLADLPLATALVGGVFLTSVVTFSPLTRFAYDNLSLHVALETGEALIGGLLAYLAVQRFRSAGAVRDVVLAWTFTTLAATNLLLSALPIVTLGSRPQSTLIWAAAGMRLVAAGGLCAAAFVPGTARAPARRRLLATIGWGTLAVLVVVGLASLVAGTHLAEAVEPSLSPSSSSRPRLVGHPAVPVIQALATALYAAAAFGFRRQAGHSGDEVLRWLAAGAVLAAFARVHFLLFPSLYSNFVYTGDVLRLASYLYFLVGASREIDAYRQDQTRLAVLEERRRLARDLHDGLVQELSFIRSQSAAMAAGVEIPDMASHLSAAAERALRESRQVVEALSGTGPPDLHEALRQAAEEVALRAGVAVEVKGPDVLRVPADVREALVRVVREAATNAVRHGKAAAVSIRLRSAGTVLHVTVGDDGKGFDPGLAAGAGFGLVSMRERVEDLGGSFTIRSEPGRGTEVDIALPLSEGP